MATVQSWETRQRLRLGVVFSGQAKKMEQHCEGLMRLVKKPCEGVHCGYMLKVMMASIPMTYTDMEHRLNSIPRSTGRMHYMVAKKTLDQSAANVEHCQRIADILLSLKVPERDVYEWLLACGFWPRAIPIAVWRSVWSMEPEVRQGFLALSKMPLAWQKAAVKEIAVELERGAWRRAVRS
jgi:hypothetical protein